MGENFDDDDWTPPTAADLKIIEARQERSNQVSKLMGNYMLQGYRMLDRLCEHCGTILLQDRQRVDYCVSCNDLETECAKDDPALSSEAARAAALEGLQSDKPREIPAASKVTPNTDRLALYGITREQTTPTVEGDLQTSSQGQGDENLEKMHETAENSPQASFKFSSTRNQLKDKISWATNELRNSPSLESSIQLCNLIKACSEALLALNKIQDC